MERFSKYILAEELKRLRKVYVNTFLDLMVKQLAKYVRRGRTDMMQGKPVFDLEKLQVGSAESRAVAIRDAMAHTYRGDMRRRNDVWDSIALLVLELAKSVTEKSIIYNIDMLNNSIHNTHTKVLDKFPNGGVLLKALNDCHRARNPMEFARNASRDLRDIAMQHRGL